MTGAELANSKVAEARSIMSPNRVGSDLSELIEPMIANLVEWVKSLNLDDLGLMGARIILQYVVDELIPQVVESAPTYVDLLLLNVVRPLLQKLIEKLV